MRPIQVERASAGSGRESQGATEMETHDIGHKQEAFAWIVIAAIFGLSAISFYLLWAKTV